MKTGRRETISRQISDLFRSVVVGGDATFCPNDVSLRRRFRHQVACSSVANLINNLRS